ncbi:MAG TPA: proline-rich domain-containing protein [Actinophytocola sp.]|uniref:proline-rich domain-containing protein n=1 Tax=Actinophytocola sp. TaxID=1872138 RepID=UPI002DDCA055|nr:proline-rich domain-containing protein [Actinophytocola sp.]HEV2779342.1 proline-rich domain-containing protein [Actinophytocola sp.]
MTYPGSGGPWQPNNPNQPGGPGSGPFPAQPGYPQQQGGYQPPPGYQTGPQPTQGYPQQGFPQTGPQPTMQYGQYGGQSGYPPPQPPKKSRKGLIIGAIVAVVAIAAGSVVTVWALNRSDVKAGAPSPTAAADNLVSAIGKGDLAGVLASLAPAEASIMVDLNKDMTEELKRLDVYKQDADPNQIHGAEIRTTDLKYDDAAAEKVNDHLTITKLVGGKLTIDSDAAKLPFTERFLEAAFPRGLNSDPQHEEIDIAEATDNGRKPIRIATVNVDGQWYPSLFYTIADYALQDADKPWPRQGIANNGAGSPQDAVRELAQAAADGNLERVIELLPPDEMGALHDAGPVLVEMAGRPKPSGAKITNFSADTQDVTNGKKVVIKEAEVQVEGGTVKIRRDGDCYSYEAEGESEKFCGDQVAELIDKESRGDSKISAEAKQALVNLASGMLKNTGIVTTNIDGKWYVSPLRSFTDIELTVLKSLSADDVYALLKLAK